MNENDVSVWTETDDPAIRSFLNFLAGDIERRPEAIATLSSACTARIAALTEGADIEPSDAIDGEVDL